MSLPLPLDREFDDWLQHPVTRYVRQVLDQKRDELRRQWESGSFTDYERDATVLVNVGNMGTCKGYAFVSELTYEDLLTEVVDEPKRISAPGRSSID